MGITLTFRPTPTPAEPVAEQLKIKCQDLGPHTTWWSEMPSFLEVPTRGLVGMQKVSLSGYSISGGGFQEVEPEEDFLMMWNDISRTTLALSGWAKEFGVEWDILLEGEPFGSIDKHGNSSEELNSSLSELLLMTDAPPNEHERASLIEDIKQKYASRW